jgi:hypothetical protein
MYPNDHDPPHFHAIYAEHEAMIGISPLQVLEGNLPPRALALVIEWTALHRAELLDNWNRLRRLQSPAQIAPLP